MKNRRDGFTLMELLVCVGIILLLLGAMIPTYFSIREAARRRDVLNTIEQVETALRAYQSDYRELPILITSPSVRVSEFTTNWVAILNGDNTNHNTKGFAYLEFSTNELAQGVYDSWGKRLMIALDGGPDPINNPVYNTKIDVPGHGVVNRSVGVWSKARKNGMLESDDAKDDVCSWK